MTERMCSICKPINDYDYTIKGKYPFLFVCVPVQSEENRGREGVVIGEVNLRRLLMDDVGKGLKRDVTSLFK